MTTNRSRRFRPSIDSLERKALLDGGLISTATAVAVFTVQDEATMSEPSGSDLPLGPVTLPQTPADSAVGGIAFPPSTVIPVLPVPGPAPDYNPMVPQCVTSTDYNALLQSEGEAPVPVDQRALRGDTGGGGYVDPATLASTPMVPLVQTPPTYPIVPAPLPPVPGGLTTLSE